MMHASFLTRSRLYWAGIVVVPLLLLSLQLMHFLPDPNWPGSNFHFLIVSLSACIALLMAVFMTVAASQLQDARVVFLSWAFLGISGIFAVHGLTTPGAIVPGFNPWVGFSAHLALLIGAICLALSTVEWHSTVERTIINRQRPLTIAFGTVLISFAFLALFSSFTGTHTGHAGTQPPVSTAPGSSTAPDDYGYVAASTASQTTAGRSLLSQFDVLEDEAVKRSVMVATLLLLGLVIFRYARIQRIAPNPLISGFLVSAIFLFQGQLSMSFAPVWNASWWLYHVLLFAAFVAALAGMVVEYAYSGSLRGVVAGLLLRDTIIQMQRGYTEVIVALVGAVEAKDVYTRGHTQRVSDLAVRIGEELRLPRERLRMLAQAAMLHDIGKIGVPDSILNKPGALTPEEFAAIREHPIRGHTIIKDVRSLQGVIGGVRSHHERLDGSGYPDGLKGNEIPLEARIIAVADMYDALTSLRPYRPAWSPERALELIDEQAGEKLDAACVRALHAVLNAQPATASSPATTTPVLAD